MIQIDMKKPNHCLRCPMRGVDDECVLIRGSENFFGWEEQYANCPLQEVEPESKWIPCSERLPSDSDYYLVTDAYGDMSAIWFAHEKDYYGESEWRETEDEILAWMPLPAAYKPEEE